MAHVLDLTGYSGSALHLNSNGYTLQNNYLPMVGDGGRATDAIDVEITGTSASDLNAKWAAIQRIFADAQDWQMTRFDGYANWPSISYQPDGYSDSYSSKIFSGSIVADSRWAPSYQPTWSKFRILAHITIERQDWWDRTAEVSLSGTNGNGTGTPLAVYNCNDGAGSSPNKRNNYYEIAAADVAGDLPSPAIVHFANLGNAGKVETLYVYHNWKELITYTWPMDYEIEGLTGITQKPGSPDPSYSGSYYGEKTWTGTAETKIFDLAIANTTAAKSDYFNILMRLISNVTDLWVRWKLSFTNGVDTIIAWTGPWMNTNAVRELWNTGAVQLPPIWLFRNPGPITLSLYAKRNNAGTNTIDIDKIVIAPTQSFRTFRAISSYLNSYYEIVDDSYTGASAEWNQIGGNFINYFAAVGQQVFLRPSTLQRLYFWWNTSDAGYIADATLNAAVSVFYHPRRRSL